MNSKPKKLKGIRLESIGDPDMDFLNSTEVGKLKHFIDTQINPPTIGKIICFGTGGDINDVGSFEKLFNTNINYMPKEEEYTKEDKSEIKKILSEPTVISDSFKKVLDKKKETTNERKNTRKLFDILVEDNIVIVVDTSNYTSRYSDEVPFKAKVDSKYEFGRTINVTSEVTGKTYELYEHQLLEGLEIHQIKRMLDLSKYGSD